MNTPLVSIIIPVFGVERFIQRCLVSLFEQTYQNIEYLLVDDASKDGSMDIAKATLDKYPRRKTQVEIISHPKNQGLPAARNTGLKVAKGEYIIHVDSDDWVEIDMVEQMVNHAVSKKADIVYSDWYLTFAQNERYMKQEAHTNGEDCIKAMLQGGMRFNVWNKLVKRDLYREGAVVFPVGKAMGEDMTMIKLFAYAKVVSYLPKGFYHYLQINPNAYTKQVSLERFKEIDFNAQETIKFLERRYGDKFNDESNYFKLNVKLPLLIGNNKTSFDFWRSLYTESNPFIESNPTTNRRIKFIQWAALHKLDFIVRLHYFLIIKVIYGIIYK